MTALFSARCGADTTQDTAARDKAKLGTRPILPVQRLDKPQPPAQEKYICAGTPKGVYDFELLRAKTEILDTANFGQFLARRVKAYG